MLWMLFRYVHECLWRNSFNDCNFCLRYGILGTSWMSWSLVGSLVLGFVFLFLFPARYSRTDIDIQVQVQDDSENAENKATKPSVTERTTIYNWNWLWTPQTCTVVPVIKEQIFFILDKDCDFILITIKFIFC